MLNERQLHDIAFLVDSTKWPCWPLCSVKRYDTEGTFPTLGVVITDIPIVYETDMVRLSELTSMQFKMLKKHRYKSWKKLVVDGWRVD